MARDTNGIQTFKKPHGIEMKIPIQNGNVSKRETIEESNCECSYRESRKFRPDNFKSYGHYFEYRITRINPTAQGL